MSKQQNTVSEKSAEQANATQNCQLSMLPFHFYPPCALGVELKKNQQNEASFCENKLKLNEAFSIQKAKKTKKELNEINVLADNNTCMVAN